MNNVLTKKNEIDLAFSIRKSDFFSYEEFLNKLRHYQQVNRAKKENFHKPHS